MDMAIMGADFQVDSEEDIAHIMAADMVVVMADTEGAIIIVIIASSNFSE